MINKVKEKVQEDAFNAWVVDRIGTVEQATGTGKTFVAFRAILSMPKGSNVLFLAETTVRENTVLQDAKQYLKFYGIDPLKGYKFKFACYHGAYKYSITDYFPNANDTNTIIVMDEIHDMLSTERFKFAQNSKLETSKIPRLGLSATIDKKTLYEVQGKEITKFDLLKTFCPVVYTYSLQESMDNNTTRNINFFVLKHTLDDRTKNIASYSKGVLYKTTEKYKYAMLDRNVKQAMFLPSNTPAQAESKTRRIISLGNDRAKFLYALPSKIDVCQDLIKQIPGKTLIFGQDSKTLLTLCPNAIVSANKKYIKDLADFKAGKTNITASNIIIKQGENIPNLDTIILFSYYSKIKDWGQRIGRLRQDKAVGNVIVFVTSGTQEEKWFERMTEEMNVNFIYCTSVQQLISKL